MENLKRISTTKFIFKFVSQIKSGEGWTLSLLLGQMKPGNIANVPFVNEYKTCTSLPKNSSCSVFKKTYIFYL